MTRDWDLRGDQLAAEAIARGEPTAWFERLYAEGVAGEVDMPWDRTTPHLLLQEWATVTRLDGGGQRAVVVGCGLGADAEFLATLGFATTGFDVSATAIAQARRRNPGSRVDYRVADLLALPDDLVGGFDLVIEVFTLQALPDPPRAAAAGAVARLVRDGGRLLLIAFRYDGTQPTDQGPPYPLSREDLDVLATGGLELVRADELVGPRWRAEYARAPSR